MSLRTLRKLDVLCDKDESKRRGRKDLRRVLRDSILFRHKSFRRADSYKFTFQTPSFFSKSQVCYSGLTRQPPQSHGSTTEKYQGRRATLIDHRKPFQDAASFRESFDPDSKFRHYLRVHCSCS